MNRWILTVVVLCAFLLAGLGVLYLPGFFTAGTESTSGQVSPQIAGGPPTGEKAPPVDPGQPSTAQSDASAGPGWTRRCNSQAKDEGLECRISKTVVEKQSKQVLTNVTLRISADTKQPQISIRMPLRLYLPAGASYQVDENTPQVLNFKACNSRGCYAQTAVTPETLAALKRGKQLTIRFETLARKPIKIPLSLGGFEDAYDKLQGPS